MPYHDTCIIPCYNFNFNMQSGKSPCPMQCPQPLQHCLLLLTEWGSRLRWLTLTHKLLWHKWDASSSFGIFRLLNCTINASLWTCFFFHVFVSGSLYDSKPYNLLDVTFPAHILQSLLCAGAEYKEIFADRLSKKSSIATCKWCRNTLLLIIMSVISNRYHFCEFMAKKLIF